MQNTNIYTLGIDVGSTTVKTVVCTESGEILHSDYERHFSKVKETVIQQLQEIAEKFPNARFRSSMTGSAGLGLANAAEISFVQEVHAAFLAVKKTFPDTDVVIELGGEDAKMIFLTGGVEQRMNGSCAGGTGAFIDQMATLLGITVQELDEAALKAKRTYPIASRCGVFAKSDIQPLLNQGASREDVAASIFKAVVDQTVAGLAQGREIKGKVLFLGGPLSFQKGLRKAFVQGLGLSEGNAIFPEHAPVFVALGSALYALESKDSPKTAELLLQKVQKAKVRSDVMTGEKLFSSREEYAQFVERHKQCDLRYADLRTYEGNAYLGIDSGSTTTKLVLITENGELLYSHYSPNEGQPLDKIAERLKQIYEDKNENLHIKASAVTGYGEDLIRAGLSVDYGIVETVAHFKAAAFFCPNVDFIIDIGGQDIKCFKIKNGAIDSIMLNEACSSGCGSFIQTFAMALGYDIGEFSQMGLFAEHPVELGSRCTVFMNSSVKQAQKDGATVEDISAGLSSSIIKNAIYKVIRARSTDELGKNIVVQGGTFLNDAVLRCFEREIGRQVIRPAISGLMGAFGAALYAKQQQEENGETTLISPEALEKFSYTSRNIRCGGCTANCLLNVIKFSDGGKFISGNRCEKGAGVKRETEVPDLYDYKYHYLMNLVKKNPKHPKAVIGIPMVLNYYELLPFWYTLFTKLGFSVVLSGESNRKMYFKGQHTIPSDTVCYPAKIAHGHIEALLEKNVDLIFWSCMTYNLKEPNTDNQFNCPVVAYYPELMKANHSGLTEENFFNPYLDINSRKNVIQVIRKTFKKYNIYREVPAAVDSAYQALADYRKLVMYKAKEIISQARAEGRKIIVLAGRPYHLDEEINHGIHKLITSLGLAVVSEDSVAMFGKMPHLHVYNQWTYHSRLYRAAQYVTTQPDMQLVQLVSFGCGIDAITTDEVRSILESSGKLYTQLKIDEITNLGAAKIRLRSLLAAMNA